MADIIRYSPIEHQVEKLKSQGLIISDEDYVKALLSQCGYSNLIKSYRDPYIFSTAMGLKYREGITFEQVASLYFFDRSLRNAVMSSMLDLEEHVKTVAAEVVAKNIGTDHNVYLNKRNYRNKRVRNQHFTLDAILGNILDQSVTANRKQELRGRIWAYNRLIGLTGILRAYKMGCRNRYEIAECLDVPEETLQEALNYYHARYGVCTQVDNYVIYFEPALGVMELI